MKKVKGKLTVSYPSGGDTVRITIDDESSSVELMMVEIDYEQWARAQASHYGRPCEVRIGRVDLVGKVHQVKEEFVADNEDVSKFEVDGWKARGGDFGNYHRRTEKGKKIGFNCVFFRYVDP